MLGGHFAPESSSRGCGVRVLKGFSRIGPVRPAVSSVIFQSGLAGMAGRIGRLLPKHVRPAFALRARLLGYRRRWRPCRTSRTNRGQMSMKASDTALRQAFFSFLMVDYWPVTANQTPSGSPAAAGDVTRTIGAMHRDGSFTVPAMLELPAVSAGNVLVKKSIPLFASAGS